MPTNRSVVPYLLITPAVLFLALLFLVPLVQTIWLAMSQDGSFSLTNFHTLTNDLNFGAAIRNTFLLTLAVVPIQVIMALVMGSMVAKVGGTARSHLVSRPAPSLPTRPLSCVPGSKVWHWTSPRSEA